MEKRVIRRGAVDDLVLLDGNPTEKDIVKNLQNRFDEDRIYTYIGPVLLSVNPYKQIRGLYDKSLIQKYERRYQYELAPHVFAVAEDAFRQVLKTGVDQCVLVSGESGAGKTEAAKKFMEYVTEVSGDVHAKRDVRDIKGALLSSNPVLEAFGNAKTIRNDNSSRFGKYMEIQMDYGGVPLGGRIRNYLLEKPRVVGPGEGERSFHVFYQLCAGAGSEYGLGKAKDYKYLTAGNTTSVKGLDDVADYREMVQAMDIVGIDKGRKKEIFSLVAGVLWLGNISFSNKGSSASVSSSSKSALKSAAKSLSVSDRSLEKALLNRTLETRGERVTSPLKAEDCVKTRDALAKALYSRAFQKLVGWINERIKTSEVDLTIGVLDIYGFEIFEHNSFEQLCINYCNEKLQQLFIELTLQSEQEEYAAEGIQWKHIDYFDNKVVCDLIEAKRPAGIIAYLDEESIYPQGSDKTLLQKMNRNLDKHPHYMNLVSNTSHNVTAFGIKHYAGDVYYSTTGMLDKNKDTLFRDLIDLMGGSKSKFCKGLFPEAQQKHDMKRPTTAGWQFVLDMQKLIDTLEQCEPHYIRTIKPNDEKRSGQYDVKRVAHQVRYLGLLENVRVRRAGFAFRREYDKFVTRYKMLSDRTWPKAGYDARADTATILNAVGITGDDFQEGKTKVFIRKAESLFTLEEKRDKKLHDIATIVQNSYRGFMARRYFMELREKSMNLFHGKKRRRGSWVLYFEADYVFAKQNQFIVESFQAQGDREVLFADRVTQLYGKKNLTRQATLVITERAIYLFADLETPKPQVLFRMELQQLQSISLSTFADGWMVFKTHNPEEPHFLIESLRKAEVVTVLSEEYARVSGQILNLVFADQLEFNEMIKMSKMPWGKPKLMPRRIEFREEPSLGNNTTRTVLDTVPVKDLSILIFVPVALGSHAQMQLNSPIPDRIIQYTGKLRVAAIGKSKRPYGGFTPQPLAPGQQAPVRGKGRKGKR